MLKEKQITRLSKFLSLVLRHRPEVLGIELDENGWTSIDDLLKKLATTDKKMSIETLQYVVANNSKKRFAFNDALTMIRANQGHSVKVELDYQPIKPPKILYHGTAQKFIGNIFREGLKKRQRHHVHLSADLKTASMVGKRHGELVILEVLSQKMYEQKMDFFLSENDVWLTDHVPVEFLRKKED